MLIEFTDHANRLIHLTDDIDETDSPYKPASPQLADLLSKAGKAAISKKDRHLEEKLKKWIEENPGRPQLKNYLTVYYSLKRNNDKAFAYNHQIVEEHPDYLFARTNLALEYITSKQLQKVPEAIGPALDLTQLYPERKVFHITEYVNYYKIAAQYWLALEKADKARPIIFDLEKLQEELDDDFDLKQLTIVLMATAFKEMTGSLARQKEMSSNVRMNPTLPQITAAPVFHFPQMQWLYENSFSIEKSKIKELLQLKRSLLIKDLSAVLYDSIKRFDFFSNQEYQAWTHDFPLHALYLLKELEAEEALPGILEFLRQPEEILEFWLSDLITENIWQVIYATGKNKLSLLEEFLKEPLIYSYARMAVSTAVSQLVLHHPERRDEVVAVYKRLLHFYYANKDNKEIFDLTVVSFIIGDITDFNGSELTEQMKQFYDESLVDEFIEGKWEIVKERMESSDAEREYPKKREIQDIYAIIDKLHAVESRKEDEDSPHDEFDDYEEENHTKEGTLLYRGSQPYRKEGKIGRNDPCPCGSGLKYKKCHGKNG